MKLGIVTTMSTIAGILAAVMGFMTEVLGCHPGVADLSAVCSASWLPTDFAGYAALGFGVLAIIGKLIGAGGPLANLFGQKAVVLDDSHPKSGPGTVTPAQVAAP